MEAGYAFFIGMVIIVVIKLTKIKMFERTWTKAVVFAIVFIAMITVSTVKLLMIKSSADHLITCCESYKQKYGKYPEKLTDIVPEFIDRIPPARYTNFGTNGFNYFPLEGRHILGFNSVVFLKTDYNFETKTWRSWD